MNDHSAIQNVELRHLRLFVAVAETCGFSAAAEREDVATSSVSEAVRRIEHHTGVRLFHRTSRQVELTAEGSRFLIEARQAINDLDAAIARLREVAGLVRGRVSIAASPSIITRLLPSVIAEFRELHPGVSISLRDDGAEGVARRVASGEADFGVASKWAPNGDLIFTPFLYDRFGVVCRHESALAQAGGSVPWSRLAGETFISLATDTGIHAVLRRDEPGAILPDNPPITVSNTVALEAMVEAGLGVTVLPDLAAQLRVSPTLAFVPLIDPEIWRCIHVITHRSRFMLPAPQAFLTLLKDRADQILPHGMIRRA